MSLSPSFFFFFFFLPSFVLFVYFKEDTKQAQQKRHQAQQKRHQIKRQVKRPIKRQRSIKKYNRQNSRLTKGRAAF
jgi:hypothetical protein